MRLVIAGSRSLLLPSSEIDKYIRAVYPDISVITEVVSGCARGIDTSGEQWAEDNCIPIRRFPAMWNLLGRRAGHVRNREMAVYCDEAIVIYDGQSPGSKNMIRNMESIQKPVKVYIYNPRKDLKII